MIAKSIQCICQKAVADDSDHALEEFAGVRDRCPALKEILVPDSSWTDFKKVVQDDIDQAQHQSILILGFIRGYLRSITSPIHRYLIDNNKPKSLLTRQYRNDLRERWLLKNSVQERHHKSRIFFGKLTEILCAQWLEDLGWGVVNLAALGGGADIEAISPDNVSFLIEVKYVGRLDDEFMAAVESLSGKGGGFTVSPYSASNFLLFKLYTAAKQLEAFPLNRIALLVISYMTWGLVEKVLDQNWMHWDEPRFLDSNEEWNAFLEEKRKTYPAIDKDLQSTIKSLDKIWIVRNDYGFGYSLQDTVYFGNGQKQHVSLRNSKD